MKTCLDCGKPIDRHATRCVKCSHARLAAITGKQTQYQYTKNARAKDKALTGGLKDKARKAVYYARKTGKLVLGDTCYYCGSITERIQADHWHGYEPEHKTDVVPACDTCHREQERIRRTEGH